MNRQRKGQAAPLPASGAAADGNMKIGGIPFVQVCMQTAALCDTGLPGDHIRGLRAHQSGAGRSAGHPGLLRRDVPERPGGAEGLPGLGQAPHRALLPLAGRPVPGGSWDLLPHEPGGGYDDCPAHPPLPASDGHGYPGGHPHRDSPGDPLRVQAELRLGPPSCPSSARPSPASF